MTSDDDGESVLAHKNGRDVDFGVVERVGGGEWSEVVCLHFGQESE